jgi:putative hemolysin
MVAAAAYGVAASQETVALSLQGYRAEIGPDPALCRAALDLRAQAFRGGAPDTDRFDATSLHGVVHDPAGQPLVALRARLLKGRTTLADCYTAEIYDLAPLETLAGPVLDLGRVCQAPGSTDVTALRLVWAALAALVDATGVQMLIGCSSFPGCDPARHHGALATLRAHHVGPRRLRPRRKLPSAIALPADPSARTPLPPLLRSYLNMGGWVGDHAIPDPDLDTLHVFTGLRVADIPEARARRLRALARSARVQSAEPLDLTPDAP